MPKSLRSARHQRLVRHIALARKERGMTQAQLSAALGRPQSFVAKVEGGERRLEVMEFADLVQVLGLDPGRTLNEILRNE